MLQRNRHFVTTGLIRQYGRFVRMLLAVRVLDRDDILGFAPFARYLFRSAGMHGLTISPS